MQTPEGTLLALDVGEQRVGVAEAHSIARIAHPLVTLDHTTAIFDDIAELAANNDVVVIVVGLPRGMQGQDTAQTHYVHAFVADLKRHVNVPIFWQDEALTSQKAEQELDARKKPYVKGDVDALAATYILDDFLQDTTKVQA